MRPRPHNLFREKKKKKRKWTNENNLEKEREKKGGKERKKKIIIKILSTNGVNIIQHVQTGALKSMQSRKKLAFHFWDLKMRSKGLWHHHFNNKELTKDEEHMNRCQIL